MEVLIADPAELVATREVIAELAQELFATGQTQEAGVFLFTVPRMLIRLNDTVSVCLDYHDRDIIINRWSDHEDFRSKLFTSEG